MSLTACSSGAEPVTASPQEQSQTFSEEDKRVALALSVSRNQVVTDAEGPYAQALLCRNGMEVLAERLKGALNAQQRQAIDQAREYFDRQVSELGESEGKVPSEITSDVERTAQDNFNVAENARVAMACLQNLQKT